MTRQAKIARAKLLMLIAVEAHRLNYEWMPPDPRQDGKSLRPWDQQKQERQDKKQ